MHFVLNLIRPYIYQASLLYFGDTSCRCSVDITKKPFTFWRPNTGSSYEYLRKRRKGYLYIYSHISVLLYHFNK